jgi:hypothetical protein
LNLPARALDAAEHGEPAQRLEHTAGDDGERISHEPATDAATVDRREVLDLREQLPAPVSGRHQHVVPIATGHGRADGDDSTRDRRRRSQVILQGHAP